jgi:hypothetical protein
MLGADVLAVFGGFFIGTYPIFVKAPSVIAADVHPVVFQGYKSLWVAASGAAFVGVRWASGAEPAFAFTWWAVLSALAWVPAGTCLIGAVPRVGVGAGVLIFDGSTTLLSFCVFTLAFHEPLRVHTTESGFVYYLAPLYLVTALLGMVCLVVLPKWVSRAVTVADDEHRTRAEPLLGARAPLKEGFSRRQLVGYVLAVAAGALSALQYGIVTVGKKHAGPGAAAKEALDPIGSWTLTFGLASCVANGAALLVVWAMRASRSLPPPILWPSSAVAARASAAGVAYALSVLCTTLAVERGGNAVTLAQRARDGSPPDTPSSRAMCTAVRPTLVRSSHVRAGNAMSLVTSGTWGLLWYREVTGFAAVAWAAAAALTMGSVVLLGLEKGGA